jgi:uncharacterized membrane-anchored protein YjiN (DUF445 family)
MKNRKPGRNRLGTASLLGAAVGFLLANFVPWPVIGGIMLLPGLSLKGLIAAFFDASLVGALADWFAVSALFRYPLGLRLPHTNVIARNKDAVAEAVPRFLSGFVSTDAVRAELGRIDFAAFLERAIGEGGQRAELHQFVRLRLGQAAEGEGLAAEVRAMVAGLRDLVAREVDLPGAGASVAEWARQGEYTGRIIEGLALLLKTEMDRNHGELVAFLTKKIKKGAGWQGIFIGPGTTERILAAIKAELDGIQRDPSHEIRRFIFAALDSWTLRLRRDEPERERFRHLVTDAIANPEFLDQAQRFAVELAERVGRDLASPESRFVGTLERLEDLLLERIGADPEFRAAFNRNLVELLGDLIARSHLIETMSAYLAAQMKRTDTGLFVAQVEKAVWNDLQYIRVNGAVVGGLAGLVLALLRALAG